MAQIESFFLGIIASLGALVVELIVFVAFSAYTNPASEISFSQLFLVPGFIAVGAGIEEIFKYVVIVKRVEMLSLSRSYLINSFLVGLGFFSLELGLIATTSSLPPTNTLLEIAIIHIGTSGIIGYIIATKNPKKIGTFLYAIILTSMLHSAYNLLVLNRTFFLNFVVFALLGFILLLNIVNLIRINKELAQD